jgi:purine-cytosine permease-like protein
MIIDFFAQISDTLGIFGVSLVLIAYFLINTNKVSSQNLSYPILNLIGSSCIFYSLIFHFNLASVVIEVAWMIISSLGLVRVLLARKNANTINGNVIQINERKRGDCKKTAHPNLGLPL